MARKKKKQRKRGNTTGSRKSSESLCDEGKAQPKNGVRSDHLKVILDNVLPRWQMLFVNNSLEKLEVGGEEEYEAMWAWFHELNESEKNRILYIHDPGKVVLVKCILDRAREVGNGLDGMFLCVQSPSRMGAVACCECVFLPWNKLLLTSSEFVEPSIESKKAEQLLFRSVEVFDCETPGERCVLGLKPSCFGEIRSIFEHSLGEKISMGRLSNVEIRTSDDDQQSSLNTGALTKLPTILYSGSLGSLMAVLFLKHIHACYLVREKKQNLRALGFDRSRLGIQKYSYLEDRVKETTLPIGVVTNESLLQKLFKVDFLEWGSEKDIRMCEQARQILSEHSESIAEAFVLQSKKNVIESTPRHVSAPTQGGHFVEEVEDDSEEEEEEEEEEESNQEKVTPELVSLLPIRVEEQDMDEEGWEQVTKNARKRLSPKGADGDSKQVLACTDSFETIACSDSCARSRGDSGETISLSSVNSSNSIVEEAQQIISVPVSPDNLCSQQLTVSSIVVPQLRISPAYHNTTVHVVPNVGLQTEVLASSSRLVNHLCTVEGIRDSVSSALSYDLQEMATMLEEIAERRRPWQLAVAERIKEAVETLFPGASAQVFGSLATSLAAPCSDLDMVIQNLSCPPAIALRTLVIHLKQQSWVQMLQAVEHSAVPVIRLSTAQIPISFGNQGSLINVDITFDSMTHRGLLTCTLVKQLLHRYPPLKPLTLVLKQFLVEKGLNDPFVGGLSSYGLVLMITHILQKHFPSGIPLGDISHTQFLGPIFVSFLCEYANPKFPEQGVWVDPSSFQSQEDILRRRKEASIMLQHLKVSKAPLYILDPLDIRNNIGRTCFGINQVIQAFSEALEAIRITAVRPATLNQDWSILGSVFSTGHHRHVVNLVTKVWCPRENPARTTFELREWALTAKSVMETVSQMNHICPICKHKPHAASCTLKQLLLNFPS